MEKERIKGKFSSTPLPLVLFLIWRTEKSGRLKIKKGRSQKEYFFKKGIIVGELVSFPEKKFLSFLAQNKFIEPENLEKCRAYAAAQRRGPLASLLELSFFSPSRLWDFVEEFYKNELFSFFDTSQADYSFSSEDVPWSSQLLSNNQTLELILAGIRKMKNHQLIEAHLPPETEILELISPGYMKKLNLSPSERYVYDLLDNKKNLETLYRESRLGKRETQKSIFAFLILGIAAVLGHNKVKAPQAGFSLEEFDKILESFNAKLSYIYKYISKEIGPVAFNRLSKCLDDIRPFLGPAFEELELQPDGTIKLNSFLKMDYSLHGNERWKNLIQGFNEILCAEVLTVKKTLGNVHEAALVENLKKIGELS
ncbi:MAG: DUF4388 domain-containing protein [Candidatus Aminicenantales bacterium]